VAISGKPKLKNQKAKMRKAKTSQKSKAKV
jgi:hypothetical protein